MSATTAVTSPVSWTRANNWDQGSESETSFMERSEGTDWAIRPESRGDTLTGDTPVEGRDGGSV